MGGNRNPTRLLYQGISVIPVAIPMQYFHPVSYHTSLIPCVFCSLSCGLILSVPVLWSVSVYYGITISMLYRWMHLFQQQKALWLGVLENISVLAVPFIDSMNGIFLKDFFLAFCFAYLESLHGTDPEMLSRQSHHPGSIT